MSKNSFLLCLFSIISLLNFQCKNENKTSEKKEKEVIYIVRRETKPSAEVQEIRLFDTINNVLKSKEGLIENSLLKSDNEGSKFGYLIFATWKSQDFFEKAVKNIPAITKDKELIKDFAYELDFELQSENTNKKVESYYIVHFKIDSRQIGKDFNKTVKSMASSLITSKGNVYYKLYKNIDPKNATYQYVLVSGWNSMEDFSNALNNNTLYISQVNNLKETVEATVNFYTKIK